MPGRTTYNKCVGELKSAGSSFYHSVYLDLVCFKVQAAVARRPIWTCWVAPDSGVPQESHLDPEGFPIDGHARLGCRASGSPSLLGSSHTLECPSDSVSHLSHSLTPFSATEAKHEVIKNPIELSKSPIELIKSPIELIKSPIEVIKSPIEVLPEIMQVSSTHSHRIGVIWFCRHLPKCLFVLVLSSPLPCLPDA